MTTSVDTYATTTSIDKSALTHLIDKMYHCQGHNLWMVFVFLIILSFVHLRNEVWKKVGTVHVYRTSTRVLWTLAYLVAFAITIASLVVNHQDRAASIANPLKYLNAIHQIPILYIAQGVVVVGVFVLLVFAVLDHLK